jgi:hypothetical protein
MPKDLIFLRLTAVRRSDGGVFGTFIDWRGYPTIFAAASKLALSPLNLIVWAKTNAGMGSPTVFDHAYVFKNGCKVDDQIHAAAEIGVRFVVSRGSMSLGQSKGGLPPDDCVEDEKEILSDSVRVIEQYHNPKPGSMLQADISASPSRNPAAKQN